MYNSEKNEISITKKPPPPLRRIIGDNIRSMRCALGWSQEKLAVKAGVSLNFLGNLERAMVNVSAETLARIAGQLHVETYELLKQKRGTDSKDG